MTLEHLSNELEEWEDWASWAIEPEDRGLITILKEARYALAISGVSEWEGLRDQGKI